MEDHTRRTFLGRLLASAGVWLLGLLPGTFFSRRKALAQAPSRQLRPAPTLENALPKINRSNIRMELPKLAISNEDKVAIAAVTEIPPAQLKESIAQLKSGIPINKVGGGVGCGGGCNGWGFVCGVSCHPGPDTIGAFDVKGELGINMKSIRRSNLLNSLERAAKLRGL
jgi:hypothetical protein